MRKRREGKRRRRSKRERREAGESAAAWGAGREGLIAHSTSSNQKHSRR